MRTVRGARWLGALLVAVVSCNKPEARRCAADSDCEHGWCGNGGYCVRTPTALRIVVPNDLAQTNGPVRVQIAADFHVDSIDLLCDGAVVASLTSPYEYLWQTSEVPEGAHELTARAVSLEGATVMSDPVTVIVDRAPPTVVSRSPRPGEDNVWVRAPIELTFSEPVRAETVTDSSVLVSGSGSVALGKTLSLSADGKTLKIALASAPALPNTFLVTLTNAVADLAGNPLSVPPDPWSFTMPSWWHPWPLPLNVGASSYSFPRLVLDQADRPIVAWTTDQLYVSRWNGTSWQPVGSPIHGLAADIQYFELGVGADGQPVIAWKEVLTSEAWPPYWIFAARWTGSEWTSLNGAPLSASQAVTTGEGRTGGVRLVLDPAGDVFIATQSIISDVYNVVVKRWGARSGAWSDLGTVNMDVSRDAGLCDAALGPTGTLYVAWIEGGETTPPMGDGDLWVKSWSTSGWLPVGGAKAINPSGRLALGALLRVARDDKPIVAWVDYVYVQDASQADYALRLAFPGLGSWYVGWPRVNDTISIRPSSVSMVLDSADRPFIAYVEGDVEVKALREGQWIRIGSAPEDAGMRAAGLTLALGAEDLPYLAFGQRSGLQDGQQMVKVLNQ